MDPDSRKSDKRGVRFSFSDERLKENITEIGTLSDGETPVIVFNYKHDPQRHIGVRAQDVEKKVPASVTKIGKDQIRIVNYDILAEAMGKAA